MWNPSAADLIALRAAVTNLDAKIDQMMMRLVESAPDADARSCDVAAASPAPSAPAHVGWSPTPAADAAALAEPDRPVPCPDIAGLHHRALRPDIFAHVDYESLETYFRLVYLMGCPGLRNLSRDLGLSGLKIGTCDDLRLRRRQDELSYQRYASCWPRADGWSPPEAGWGIWAPMYVMPRSAPSANSPVTVERHCLRVKIPKTLHYRDFDDAFDEALRPGAIWPWLMSAEGRAHCERLGVDRNRGHRGTPGHNPVQEADELYIVRLSRRANDVDVLISIVESIVARALGLVC
ncbi:MAG: hypothetical protein ACLPN5_21665 [Roseiarcus sp.]